MRYLEAFPSTFLLFLAFLPRWSWIASRSGIRRSSSICMPGSHRCLPTVWNRRVTGPQSLLPHHCRCRLWRAESLSLSCWCVSGSVPSASCSRRIFAERFPELVQRYVRMTDRLIKALQAAGVITNGADAAQMASSFGVPTTAKTIIRRVLQLPLPSEGSVHKVGIDEWAWKKGHRYGTILVDLQKRRSCSCWQTVRWRRVKRGCASIPKLICLPRSRQNLP